MSKTSMAAAHWRWSVATSLLMAVIAVRAEDVFVADLSLADTNTADSAVAESTFWLSYRIESGPMKYLEWLWKDPVNLGTRPFFWHADQWRTLGIDVAVVGALLPADDSVRDIFQDNHSKGFSNILDPIRNYYTGNMLEYYGAGAFAAGLIVRNEKLADTGFLAAESVYYSSQMAGALKQLTQRERPGSAKNQYEFNGPGGKTHNGSSSFVSGEVAGAYAFSASVSEVWQNPWVTWPLYGLSGAVALHRMEHNNHWLTDCVAAGILGHAVGKSIVRFHYRRDLEGRVMPFVSGDAVGLQVSASF